MAMIFGVQQSYTRRRLAEMDIRFHGSAYPGDEDSEAPEEASDAPESGNAAPEAPKAEPSSAAAYLQQHLRGVPDVQREAASTAAAAAASSPVVSITSSAVRFSSGRDSADVSEPPPPSGPGEADSAGELGQARPAIPALRAPRVVLDKADGDGGAGLSP